MSPLLFAFLMAEPFVEKQDVFPLDAKHNHASSIVELPDGDWLVCWYRGSGERTADDVAVMGARKKKGAKRWSAPFVLADTPGFPDTNPMLFVDSQQRLWLFWQAIVANRWETAITRYMVTKRWRGAGAPQWDRSDIMLLKPENFRERVKELMPGVGVNDPRLVEYRKRIIDAAQDKYASRMGWMTRAHATELPGGRLLVPLYSDGFNFSLVAWTEDGGLTWGASEPMITAGGVQPSICRRKDGTLVAYLRDNGPPPKRVQVSESKDNGRTWTVSRDIDVLNSGSGVEAMVLKTGEWLFIGNDTERGRHSLVLLLSDDEGRTWKWKRHLELDQRAERASSFHYPSLWQGRDGSIHASYSVFLNHLPKDAPQKTIRNARFTVEWVKEGE